MEEHPNNAVIPCDARSPPLIKTADRITHFGHILYRSTCWSVKKKKNNALKLLWINTRHLGEALQQEIALNDSNSSLSQSHWLCNANMINGGRVCFGKPASRRPRGQKVDVGAKY